MGYTLSNAPVTSYNRSTTKLSSIVEQFSIPFLKSRLNASEKGIVILTDYLSSLTDMVSERSEGNEEGKPPRGTNGVGIVVRMWIKPTLLHML